MSTVAERDDLRRLIQHVTRAFYEAKYQIVLDQLSRHQILKEDQLAGILGITSKDLNKIMAILINDGLVATHKQNELREGAQRAVMKQYYYIDYRLCCNVIKWRVAEMRRKIDDSLRNELDNKGYACPQCKKSFAPLDIQDLFNPMDGLFHCDVCNHEVIDNDNAESVMGSQDRMKRFNHQTRFIREGLRKTEDMILPAFDAAALVKHLQAENAVKADPSLGELKIAGSGPSTQKDDGIGVVMSLDKDEATRRQERDAQAEAKRQQNAMPAWHLASTVSGDMTALGVKEAQRAAMKAAQLQASRMDDSLKGLGKVGGAADVKPIISVVTGEVEDVKPVINAESDYYDQYYARLQQSSSNSQTPQVAQATADDSDMDDDDDDEEGKTPASTAYLTSLKDYRKRSRSIDDPGASEKKKLKTATSTSTPQNNTPDSSLATPPTTQQGDDPNTEEAPADDPIVQVAGESKRYSEVTEEDQELMTPEEYEAYANIGLSM